jgi:hypothetical protein
VDISFVRAWGAQDRIHVVHGDGAELTWPWIKAGGQLPHDLMHYLVETHLGLRDGFWGLVAEGIDFGLLTEAAERIAGGAISPGLTRQGPVRAGPGRVRGRRPAGRRRRDHVKRQPRPFRKALCETRQDGLGAAVG